MDNLRRAKSIPNLSFVSVDASRLPSLLLHNGLLNNTKPAAELRQDRIAFHLATWSERKHTIYETNFI
jgi:hypothetical protein